MDARCEKRTAVSFSLQGYSGAMLLPLPPLVFFFFLLLLLLLLTSRVALQQMRMRRGMRHCPGEKFTDAGASSHDPQWRSCSFV